MKIDQTPERPEPRNKYEGRLAVTANSTDKESRVRGGGEAIRPSGGSMAETAKEADTRSHGTKDRAKSFRSAGLSRSEHSAHIATVGNSGDAGGARSLLKNKDGIGNNSSVRDLQGHNRNDNRNENGGGTGGGSGGDGAGDRYERNKRIGPQHSRVFEQNPTRRRLGGDVKR